MKRYFLILVLLLYLQTSYAQLITLPWDTAICKNSSFVVPPDQQFVINPANDEIQLALIQNVFKSPEVRTLGLGLTINPHNHSGTIYGIMYYSYTRMV